MRYYDLKEKLRGIKQARTKKQRETVVMLFKRLVHQGASIMPTPRTRKLAYASTSFLLTELAQAS